jgi:Tannase and feruloyl esterase
MAIMGTRLRHVAIGFNVAALLALSRSDPFAWQDANQVVSRSSPPQRCAELKNPKGLPNATTVITTASLNPAAGLRPAANAGGAPTPALPEHCEVFGTLNERTGIDGQRYAIKFHLRLPTTWNGRFYFQGGGGFNGVVGSALGFIQDPPNLLERGYAIVSQDAGHDNAVNNDPAHGGPASFGWDPQARIDMGYNSYIQVTTTAKALIVAYYGRGPEKSYFSACSEGGREGLMLSERFPEAFDGILSRSPAIRTPQQMVAAIHDDQAFAAVARAANLTDVNGQPAINKTFTEHDLTLVSSAVLAACDTLDGLKDGMVQNFTACTSTLVKPKLSAITCHGAKTDTCLSTAQVNALEAVFDGTRTSSGLQIHPGYVWDAGMADSRNIVRSVGGAEGSWRDRKLGAYESPANSAGNVTLALAMNVLTTPPVGVARTDALAFALAFRIDDGMHLLSNTTGVYRESALDFLKADATDLAGFRTHHGKLVVIHGASDPGTSILDTIDWWKNVDARNKGRANEFVRLFGVPGMNHCGGGPATDQFDAFGTLVDWVEKGVAPDRILATAPATTPWPGRTRPLCVYPAYARYTGKGSIEDAANFVCR